MFAQEPNYSVSKPSGLWKFFPKFITLIICNYMGAHKTGRLIEIVRIIGGGKRYKSMPLEQMKLMVFGIIF
jgi:hypothetical protein